MAEAYQILSKFCLHGHEMKNPYTGELVYVPCGTCSVCRYNKSKTDTLKVYAEEQIKKYCYFGSLTYSAKYVPRYKIETVKVDGDLGIYRAVPISRPVMFAKRKIHRGSRIVDKTFKVRGLASTDDVESFYFTAKQKYVDDYCKKADCGFVKGALKYPEYQNTYGFIHWSDLALFMKRVRKLIFKYNIDEKISVYLVAEYGPVTFRPHFHFLFFFNSDRLASCIRQIVSACWRFGRCDISASRGDASSYVAEYTNSFSRVPQHLLDNSKFRPRARFSNNFNFQFFVPSISKALQGDFTDFVDGVDINKNGKVLKLYPSSQVVHSCFIPFAAHRSQSVSTLYDLCVATHGIYHRFRGGTDYSTSINIYNYFKNLTNYELSCELDQSKDFSTNVIVHHLRFVNHSLDFVDGELCCSRFYNLIRTVSRFFHCNGLDFYSPSINRHKLYCALKRSIDFYKFRDYENLKTTFQLIEDSGNSLLYNLVSQTEKKNKTLMDSDVGIQSSYHVDRLINMSVKHRELNDANLCFTNSYLYG